MDWLQFISSIVSSLAWPFVFGAFLYLVRGRLNTLLSRLIELHLPGGAKAIFAKELDSARDVAEVIKPEIQSLGRARTTDAATDTIHLQAAKRYPQMVIIESYAGLENILSEIRSKLNLSERINFSAIMRVLLERHLVDEKLVNLFDSLRKARNAAVHAPANEINSAEAIEFATQLAILTDLLRDVAKKL